MNLTKLNPKLFDKDVEVELKFGTAVEMDGIDIVKSR